MVCSRTDMARLLIDAAICRMSPTNGPWSFEQLGRRWLLDSGLFRYVSQRSAGSQRGRDIDALAHDGTRWMVECKRYRNPIGYDRVSGKVLALFMMRPELHPRVFLVLATAAVTSEARDALDFLSACTGIAHEIVDSQTRQSDLTRLQTLALGFWPSTREFLAESGAGDLGKIDKEVARFDLDRLRVQSSALLSSVAPKASPIGSLLTLLDSRTELVEVFLNLLPRLRVEFETCLRADPRNANRSFSSFLIEVMTTGLRRMGVEET